MRTKTTAQFGGTEESLGHKQHDGIHVLHDIVVS